MRTVLKNQKEVETCTFYCRNVEVKNKDFAQKEAARLGYKTVGRYINDLIAYRREQANKKKK